MGGSTRRPLGPDWGTNCRCAVPGCALSTNATCVARISSPCPGRALGDQRTAADVPPLLYPFVRHRRQCPAGGGGGGGLSLLSLPRSNRTPSGPARHFSRSTFF